VIISARGTVGKVALVGTPMAMNQSCYGLRGTIGDSGAFTFFSTKNLTQILKQNAHGSVFDTITRQTFEMVDTVKPPRDIVLTYESTAMSLLNRIHANLVQSSRLIDLRDALLPKLMSGEVRVHAPDVSSDASE
jgi:type I restriction enzyme S subunit